MHACCRQVRDVLGYGKKLHAEISAFYERANQHEQREQVSMLLDYLGRHERHLEENMARFEHDARRNIMDAWLSHAPRMNIEPLVENCEIKADMNLDEVIQIACQFDDALVALYKEVAAVAKEPRIKEVFQNLAALEETEKVQMLRSAMGLRDM